MKHLLLLLTVLSLNTAADSISFGAATNHNDVMMCGHKCNEDNKLIAFEYKSLVLATFDNSHYKQTYLAAKKIKLFVGVSFLAGVSHGYDRDCFNPSKTGCQHDGQYNSEFVPFAALLIQKDFGQFKLSWLEVLYMRSFLIGVSF